MYGKTKASGDPYRAEFTLQNIQLNEIGTYELRYYIFMLCGDRICNGSQDNILIKLTDTLNSNNLVNFKHDLNNIPFQKNWNNHSKMFTVTNTYSIVNVGIYNFKILINFKKHFFYFFLILS